MYNSLFVFNFNLFLIFERILYSNRSGHVDFTRYDFCRIYKRDSIATRICHFSI